MIHIIRNNISIFTMSEVDRDLLAPYIRYSEYILYILGRYDRSITDAFKYLDLADRHIAPHGITSIHGNREWGRLYGTFRQEIPYLVFPWLLDSHTFPYTTLFGVSPYIRETLASTDIASRLSTLLNTFERRLSFRGDAPLPSRGALGRSLFTWFVTQLTTPVNALDLLQTWNASESHPHISSAACARFHTLFTQIPLETWQRLLPTLFVPQRDAGPLLAEINRVIHTLANGRHTSPALVRRLVGVR